MRAPVTLVRTLALCVAAGTGSCKAGDSDPAPNRAVAEQPVLAPARAPAPAPAPARAQGGEAYSWNDAQIAWQPFDQGLAQARAQHKPICLVFYATWCPHCKNFSKVFNDAGVVERAKRFVMIRLDSDRNPAENSRYSPDGEYIPRTLFLASDATIDPSIAAPRPQYRYFYDEHDPSSLLAGMQRALARLDGAAR